MKKLICIISLLGAPVVLADGVLFKPTVIGIDLNQQTLFVGFDQQAITIPTQCASKYEFKWNLSDPGVREIYSLMLTAKASSKRVYVEIDSARCVQTQITGRWAWMEQ
ncbi:MAG TPA: hypothetical protein VLF09_16185 [Cellvibrio sp.]|nr:hypothetical protein [Cellvibrio sp.]